MTEAEEMLPHVLVVDDDIRLRNLLRRYLSTHGLHVSAAGDALEARQALERFDYDLVVLDVMMPGENGFDLTSALRSEGDLPILLLTARQAAEDRITGLEAGADDYLVKPFEPRELLLRIQRILDRARRNAAPAAETEVHFGPFTFDCTRQELRHDDDIIHLTTGERQMLSVLAANPGVAVDRTDLAPVPDAVGSDRAVDAQVMRLRRKIEVDARKPRYLVTVRGKGYALRGGG